MIYPIFLGMVFFYLYRYRNSKAYADRKKAYLEGKYQRPSMSEIVKKFEDAYDKQKKEEQETSPQEILLKNLWIVIIFLVCWFVFYLFLK